MLPKLKYILPMLLVFTACKKQLDINVDPNNPAKVSESKLLPNVEHLLGNSLATGTGNFQGLSQALANYTHQLTTRESFNQYGLTGNDYVLQMAWTTLYGTNLNTISNTSSVLNNNEAIIKIGTANDNLKYVGIAKIIKAYTFSQMVDVFGDIPYSEFNQMIDGKVNLSPKFDKGSDIYPSLMTLLDQGIADLKNTTSANRQVPGTDDVIYGGNIEKWIRAAKTIKLKLLTQQRLIKNVSSEINALLAEKDFTQTADDLILTTADSFLMPYGPNGATDDRNPGFGDYYATQRSQYISPWFYEILKGYNPNINTGIEDPRVPYYFYNQLTPAGVASNDTEYRDGGFVSIYFGSVGPDKDKIQQNSMTVIGIYPVGGKYDDGKGGAVSAASATGAAPYRFITYADRLYLEAELITTGVIAGDAKAKLRAAMVESFKQVDYVITTYVKPSQTVPALAGTTPVTQYIDAVLAKYDAGSPAKKLEYIMTQKWISSFGSAVDQYTDYRRTGYPVLFNPKDPAMAPGGLVQPPSNGNPALPGAQKPVRVQLNRNFPLTLPWYSKELETNNNAPAQKNDPSTYKPFWLP